MAVGCAHSSTMTRKPALHSLAIVPEAISPPPLITIGCIFPVSLYTHRELKALLFYFLSCDDGRSALNEPAKSSADQSAVVYTEISS